MSRFIKSHHIYTSEGKVEGILEIQGKTIHAIHPIEGYEGSYEDHSDDIIIPGMIEMHIHGYKGWSAFSDDVAQIRGLSKALPSGGVTSYTPTVHYSDTILGNVQAITEVSEEDLVGARILGTHFEGPFISLNRLGSVLPSEVLKPSVDVMEEYYQAAKGKVTTVTLAPEVEGSEPLLDYLLEKGINICLGHTDATYEEAMWAFNKGATLTQKTGNAMRGMHHREMGTVGAAVLNPNVYNEINGDLEHISQPFAELFYKVKGYEKLCIVADEGVMTGMKRGKYNLPDRGIYHVGPDNLLHIEDMTIDGAIESMYRGFVNFVTRLQVPMEEAIVMASLNPAKCLKVDDTKGSIDVGKDADLLVIDKNYEIKKTFVEGNLCFDITSSETYENTAMYEYLIEEY